MRTILCAALAALSIASISPAIAGEGGQQANTFFTELPGVVAQAPTQNAPVASAQNGQGTQAYLTNSRGGTWLFAPNQNQGANS